MEIKTAKQRIRSEIKRFRKEMLPSQAKEWNDIILHKLINSAAFNESNTIYTYVSMEHETDTKKLIAHTLDSGKRAAVPRVEGDFIRFYYITSLSDLTPGCMGILEPQKGMKPAYSAFDMKNGTVFVLPGLAFDRAGGRVGYGGGFYDRFLSEYPGFKKTALAFSFQVMESVPSEPFDIRMDFIITEQEDIYVIK